MGYRRKDSAERKERDISGDLPLKVTAISVQKKRRDRFSLFHKKTFLLGVSAKSLTDFSIQTGTELTLSLYKEICRAEEVQKVRDSFFDYLSRRDHGSAELKQKALRKGYSPEVIDPVLEEFSSRGYLDDLAFAKKFAAEKAELKQWGPNKIRSALYQKGVGKKNVEKAVQIAVDNLDQHQICVDLLLKRRRHFLRESDSLKRKQKIYRYLAGKGFSSAVIHKATDIVKDELDV
jgi:regulatory protein